MASTSEYAADGTTLVEIIRRFEERGYGAQMAAEPGCLIRCFTCRADSPAATVHLDALRRTEGASDPADMVAVAAIRCPNCNARGTVALKYGPGASAEEAEVLQAFDGVGPEPEVPHRA